MSIDDFWESFHVENTTVVTCSSTNSVAEDALKACGVDFKGSGGGSLIGVDIKQLDVLTAIRLSLLEELANSGNLKELIVNNDGEFEFKTIGSGGGSGGDVYYEITSKTYTPKCSGVMVIGGKPLPERKLIGWKNIWENGVVKYIFDTSAMSTGCASSIFSSHAVIVFQDPQLEGSAYNDGIDNLYDVTDAHTSIIGYVYFIEAPGQTDETNIVYKKDGALIPIQIGTFAPDLGTLVNRPVAGAGSSVSPNCWPQSSGIGAGGGIEIVIPDDIRTKIIRGKAQSTLIKVEQVFMIGKELDKLKWAPSSASAAVSNDHTSYDIWASLNNIVSTTYKLDEGRNYLINYTPGENPKIVFIKESTAPDVVSFGAGTPIRFMPECAYWERVRDAVETHTILPVAGNKGYIVEELWAVVLLDLPCIVVSQLESGGGSGTASQAITIASNLTFSVAAMTMREAPAPIALNGVLIDQTDGVADHDPTTQQDFTDTALELAIESMSSGLGVTLTIPSLDEDGVKELSSQLKDLIASNTGIETTYVCGPNTSVDIGDTFKAGVVNSVSYSYVDSSSYTVSVNVGPEFIGLNGGGNGGLSFKATETYSARGTVIQDAGNHINFKVRVDGVGIVNAINTVPAIIRVGDTVVCTLHNNPVEG